LPDRDLVERFVERGDGDAFAALVRRHGAMVLGVCRRIIRHEQDAEDVSQAVFLVLSRKAGGLRRKDAVGPWLFGVAYRLALRARQKGHRRQTREARVPEATPGDPLDELSLREAQAVLDEELACLPERERGPLILCYLQGLTRDQAARRLGCALGTLKGRLERGRALLERRLTRRGLSFLTVLPVFVLARQSGSATAALQTATVEASLAFAGRSVAGRVIAPEVAELAEGALKPTLAGKFAVAAAVLVGALTFGVGVGLIASPSGTRSEARTESVPPLSPLESRAGSGTTTRPTTAIPTEKQTANEIGGARPLPTKVDGIANAVDAEKGTLTVTHREGEDTFSVAKDARIEIDGTPGELARLPAGANVSLTRFVGPKAAGSVQASGRSYFGSRVKAVDARSSTITIQDRDTEKTFAVAPNAMIWVDGKGAKLEAVPPGSFVNLTLGADQQTVRNIGADGPDLGGCGGSLVKAVDLQRRTITFDTKAPPEVAGKTFVVAANALVTIDGNKRGTLSDVPAGSYVNVLLRVDGKTVGQVRAQGPSNLCEPGGSAVKAVDAENGTITFDERAKAEVAGKTFTLAKDAIIQIDGKPGTLAALPPGSLVDMRLWVDRQTVGQIHATGRPVPGVGVVTAVDTGKNTITVGNESYSVAKDALILIDGKTVRLADVPTGVSVSLRLNVDGKTVGTIHHQNR
jgi:RNA polymerase sigma factor (sigma-70 family)